ncbi:MAG: hypothetical protein Kilf2KO_35660 [Rhodospirillales bacterium]
MKLRIAVAAALAFLAFGFGAWWFFGPMQRSSMQAQQPPLALPALSADAKAGEAHFQEDCAVCHGRYALGTDRGPPLIHRIYQPSHHGDRAFRLAVRQGVRAHHWKFGDMPAMSGLSRADVAEIIAYVRELQRANGIE